MPDLPVVHREEIGPPVRDPAVCAILLAAGSSTRFGSENKLLMRIDGEAIVRRAVSSLVEAEIGPIHVVVGHEADRVKSALSDFDVVFVNNPDYAAGQATSVRAGVASVPAATDAAVFHLGDMPAVQPESIRLVVEAYRADVADAIAAGYRGTRGNPVLFDSRYFPELQDVSDDHGGRYVLMNSDRAAIVETGDSGVTADVDDREDLAAIGDIWELES